MTNQEKYQYLDNEVWNILQASQDLDHFPPLFHDISKNALKQVDSYGLKRLTLKQAVDMFGAEAVGEFVEINLINKELSRLLNEMAEISE